MHISCCYTRRRIEAAVAEESTRTVELAAKKRLWNPDRFRNRLIRQERSLKEMKARLHRIRERMNYNHDVKEAIERRLGLLGERERAVIRRDVRRQRGGTGEAEDVRYAEALFAGMDALGMHDMGTVPSPDHTISAAGRWAPNSRGAKADAIHEPAGAQKETLTAG